MEQIKKFFEILGFIAFWMIFALGAISTPSFVIMRVNQIFECVNTPPEMRKPLDYFDKKLDRIQGLKQRIQEEIQEYEMLVKLQPGYPPPNRSSLIDIVYVHNFEVTEYNRALAPLLSGFYRQIPGVDDLFPKELRL